MGVMRMKSLAEYCRSYTNLTAMATAFVVSIASIKFLLRYIKNNDFKAFGWYRIVLGIIVIAYLLLVGDPTQS